MSKGLLILGKANIYLIDHYFQRSDQEIVDVWDAPTEERDPFIQILAGQDASTRPTMLSSKDLHESRQFSNEQLVSASQRRFLFRDVALELFFSDGRSRSLPAGRMDPAGSFLFGEAISGAHPPRCIPASHRRFRDRTSCRGGEIVTLKLPARSIYAESLEVGETLLGQGTVALELAVSM